MRLHATVAAELTRLWLLFVPVPKRDETKTFYSGEITVTASDLPILSVKINKCWKQHIKSTIVNINNCGNSMLLK